MKFSSRQRSEQPGDIGLSGGAAAAGAFGHPFPAFSQQLSDHFASALARGYAAKPARRLSPYHRYTLGIGKRRWQPGIVRLSLLAALFALIWVKADFSPRHIFSDSGTPSAADIRTLSAKAEKGDVNAEFALGWAYANGADLPKNYAAARQWYRRAADQGDVRAAFNLGDLYARGRGGRRDIAGAEKLWRAAGAKGMAAAQARLGALYQNGGRVPQDFSEALKWYGLAAQQGQPQAEYGLAVMYDRGEGLAAPDHAEALKWYVKAAQQGVDDAIVNAGLMYAHGQGAARNYKEAAFWLGVADAYGKRKDAEITAAKDDAMAHLAPEQITDVTKRIGEWRPDW